MVKVCLSRSVRDDSDGGLGGTLVEKKKPGVETGPAEDLPLRSQGRIQNNARLSGL